jgi:DNA-binding transcriptional MerR regulator
MAPTVFRKTKSGLIPFSTRFLLFYETEILDFPMFTYKQARKCIKDLTYRKINFWDSQGFISGSRSKKDTGWRRFSTVDLLIFNIITDLRNLGVSSSFIKNTLDQLDNKVVKIDLLIDQVGKTIFYKKIQISYLNCCEGDKILLFIFRGGLHLILNEKDSFEALPEIYAMTPAIILPFYAYTMNISSLLEREYSIDQDTTISSLLKNQISIKEKVIVDAVRNDKYREIIITKKNKDKIIVTAESVRSGNFSKKELLDLIDSHNYQDIKASKVNGKIIKIYQKEKIKL